MGIINKKNFFSSAIVGAFYQSHLVLHCQLKEIKKNRKSGYLLVI